MVAWACLGALPPTLAAATKRAGRVAMHDVRGRRQQHDSSGHSVSRRGAV